MQVERRLLSSEPGPLNLKLQWRRQHRIVPNKTEKWRGLSCTITALAALNIEGCPELLRIR